MYMYAHEMYEDTKKQPEGVIRMTVEIIAERKEDNGRPKKRHQENKTQKRKDLVTGTPSNYLSVRQYFQKQLLLERTIFAFR